jgi:hypothetical protein
MVYPRFEAGSGISVIGLTRVIMGWASADGTLPNKKNIPTVRDTRRISFFILVSMSNHSLSNDKNRILNQFWELIIFIKNHEY